jgi:hypothetical protein
MQYVAVILTFINQSTDILTHLISVSISHLEFVRLRLLYQYFERNTLQETNYDALYHQPRIVCSASSTDAAHIRLQPLWVICKFPEIIQTAAWKIDNKFYWTIEAKSDLYRPMSHSNLFLLETQHHSFNMFRLDFFCSFIHATDLDGVLKELFNDLCKYASTFTACSR